MDFADGKIVVRPGTDYWGPFAFDLAPALPAGDSLTAATTVQAFLAGVESTEQLIETGSIALQAAVLNLRLQYPGASLHGRHELRINLALASGARHTLVFQYVHVIP
jgi:hypothetical protein